MQLAVCMHLTVPWWGHQNTQQGCKSCPYAATWGAPSPTSPCSSAVCLIMIHINTTNMFNLLPARPPAGHGYLSAALPPPAPLLQAMADQVEGNSQLMQAAMTLALEMLRLVPLLLGACAHLSPEMPLQQYWGMVGVLWHVIVYMQRELLACRMLQLLPSSHVVVSVTSASVVVMPAHAVALQPWLRALLQSAVQP